MTDFEIQRRLRDLRLPVEPSHDLWPGIATRILAAEAVAPVPAVRRRRLPLALAAGVAVAAVAGVLSLALQRQPDPQPLVHGEATGLPGIRGVELDRIPGNDPRLAGATLVIDSAQQQLEQALEQQPEAVFLVGLLNRTHAQRMKLERIGAQAG
jgi:hypothetical protein